MPEYLTPGNCGISFFFSQPRRILADGGPLSRGTTPGSNLATPAFGVRNEKLQKQHTKNEDREQEIEETSFTSSLKRTASRIGRAVSAKLSVDKDEEESRALISSSPVPNLVPGPVSALGEDGGENVAMPEEQQERIVIPSSAAGEITNGMYRTWWH